MGPRPVPAPVAATGGWVSGAVTPLQGPPPLRRQTAGGGDAPWVARVLALGAADSQARALARRLPAAGGRSARSARLPSALLEEVRRARGHSSRTAIVKTQATRAGQWTGCGLAQALAVQRQGLSTRIRPGALPANRPPGLGPDLMPEPPDRLAPRRAQREGCG